MKVLTTEPIRPKGVAILQKEVEVVVPPDPRPETIARVISDCDALITRTTYIGRKIIDAGKNLLVIGRHGAGLDIIDVKYATRQAVPVVYTPAANARSVSEYVVGLMLSLTREIIPGDLAQRVERNFKRRNEFMGNDLEGKTIGIVGFGRIGRGIAKMCGAGFDMSVIAYDPFVSAEQMGEERVRKMSDIAALLRESDFVSLNCPLTDDVVGLINKESIALMKRGAFLINCARGPIVDETALAEALKAGTIRGAAIDVFGTEPPDPNNPLFDAPNLIATPHMATMTHESMDLMSTTLATEILSVLSGERPRFLADPEVWNSRRMPRNQPYCDTGN